MSSGSRATFAKRQKEQARREKQLAKAQRKLERKLGNQQPAQGETAEDSADETSHGSDQDLAHVDSQ